MTAHKYDYAIHPLANVFPSLSAEEFKKLKSDISTHGQQEPIMLSADGTTLLDGRHRLRACKELGIPPRAERFQQQRLSEGEYIWAKNVLRRHLTDDQRIALALKWSDAEKEAAKERQRQNLKKGTQTSEGAKTPPRGKTRKAIAEKAQASEHKARQGETVAKHAPELLPKVESGEMTLKDAEKQVTSKTKPSKAPKAKHYLSLQDAVENFGRILTLELNRAWMEYVDPRESKTFNTLVADKLELVLKQLRTATPAINVTPEEAIDLKDLFDPRYEVDPKKKTQ